MGSRYRDLGVDVRKPGIDRFKSAIDNLFPGAFCVIQRDQSNPKMGIVLHTDSAGSKPIQAYIMYRESEDSSWFKGLAQDALAMNINDVLCVGAEPISFVDYIAFNTLRIDRVKMLSVVADGFAECKDVLKRGGLPISFAGGETADLPDLLRTLDICVTIYGRVKLSEVISGGRIEPGDVIIGLRSGGRSKYEGTANSGIMSNGHTLARTCLLSNVYSIKYPEISHSTNRYTGRFRIDDHPDGLGSTVGEALLSPTRLFAPVAAAVMKSVGEGIHGMVHNTGGGQTKCLRLANNIHYVKNDLPEPDPIFHLIQTEAKVDWREMYQDFNMGIGFEFIVEPTSIESVLDVTESFDLKARIIGHCERGSGKNSLSVESRFGKFRYD